MKCKHDACKCSGSDVKADGFCSDHCRQQGQGQAVSDQKCGCGHSECR